MEKTVKQIRRFINKPRNQYNLIKNLPFWFQLCSSLDVIEDTLFAINAFNARKQEENEGMLYLLIYGLLQALFVQQDAVLHLCEALKFKENVNKYPELKKIRIIRHESVGHPTKTKEREGKSFNYISRVTMSMDGFQLIKNYSDGRFETKDISLAKCITEQRKYLKEILKTVLTTLIKEEREHKEKYMKEKIEKCFPDALHYHISKVYEASNRTHPTDMTLGKISIEAIESMTEDFKTKLEIRGIPIDAYSGIESEYGFTEYPIKVLVRHFECMEKGKRSKLNKKDAWVYVESLEKHINELKKIAKEIDDEYAEIDEDDK